MMPQAWEKSSSRRQSFSPLSPHSGLVSYWHPFNYLWASHLRVTLLFFCLKFIPQLFTPLLIYTLAQFLKPIAWLQSPLSFSLFKGGGSFLTPSQQHPALQVDKVLNLRGEAMRGDEVLLTRYWKSSIPLPDATGSFEIRTVRLNIPLEQPVMVYVRVYVLRIQEKNWEKIPNNSASRRQGNVRCNIGHI